MDLAQHIIALLAQHDPNYQRGALWVHAGSIMSFVGLLVVGVAVLFSKTTPGKPSLSPVVTRVVGATIIAAAFVVAYLMW